MGLAINIVLYPPLSECPELGETKIVQRDFRFFSLSFFPSLPLCLSLSLSSSLFFSIEALSPRQVWKHSKARLSRLSNP